MIVKIAIKRLKVYPVSECRIFCLRHITFEISSKRKHGIIAMVKRTLRNMKILPKLILWHAQGVITMTKRKEDSLRIA